MYDPKEDGLNAKEVLIIFIIVMTFALILKTKT